MKSLLLCAGGLALLSLSIGCGPTVTRNDIVTLEIQETSGLHPIRMTVNVDGADIFGPLGTLGPSETKSFPLNDPPGNRQIPGQHTVLYTFDRVGPLGAVGHARIQVLRGTSVILQDDSRKVPVGLAPTYSFRYVVKAED